MHERSLVLFLVLATGCSSSAYSATVACKDPRTMEFAQGYLNLSSHSLGDVYRLEGTQHVHVGALPVDTKDVSETPPETQELSMSQGFELRAGTEVPETVKVDLKTLVSSKLKLIMRDAKIKTARA
jgi:hypothetical protein